MDNIEQANKIAQETQWGSEIFDRNRDLDYDYFKQRKEICQTCDQLTDQLHCSQDNSFMPINCRLIQKICPLNKWNIILIQTKEPTPIDPSNPAPLDPINSIA